MRRVRSAITSSSDVSAGASSGGGALRERLGRTRGQPGAARLDDAAHVVDQLRADCHELVACAQGLEVALGVGTAVADRGHERHVGPALARQEAGVEPVVAPPPRGAGEEGTGICHDRLMAELLEQARHPRRMRSDLEHDAAPGALPEVAREAGHRGGDGRLAFAIACPVHFVDAAGSIAEIQSDR